MVFLPLGVVSTPIVHLALMGFEPLLILLYDCEPVAHLSLYHKIHVIRPVPLMVGDSAGICAA